MKTGLKRALRWIIGIVAVLLVLVIAAFAFKDPLLKAVTRWNIKSSTGLESSIGAFNVDFAASRVQITSLRLFNDPAFGKSVLLDIPEIYLELDGQEAAQGKLRFKEVRFNLAEANIVKNTNGVTNLEALKEIVEKQTLSTNGLEFAGIDKLVLNLGRVNYTDLQQPANNTQINLDLKDEVVRGLKTSEEVENWTMALLIRLAVQQAFLTKGRTPLLLDYMR